ncbi:Multiple inositol polyphosphate phosphatase 1 [Frankliniella fusca]|uniref:Multiple inositol polyphosphate phosphatase 1 n=1 Tax=Frankliniella fusca TaxID=407009 RepID=A0AAE1GUD9_9NEOP|nr:Multiple inositol polyphosphate phosphatase 1 [Frankliniella fusca]
MSPPPTVTATAVILLWSSLLLHLLLLGSATAAASDACAAPRAPQAIYSSKTAYQLVHDDDTASQDVLRGCSAAYVWHTLRHGTRYPSATQAAKLAEKIPALQKRLRDNVAAGRAHCAPAALDRMLAWTLNMTEGQGNTLHAQGERDLQGIGHRLGLRLGGFFQRHPHPDNFTFRSTDTQRTQASAKWYGNGLFEEPIKLPEPLPDDPLLEFFDICPAWTAAVDKNKTARAEVAAFEEGPTMAAALARIADRLGFQEKLTYDDVSHIWEACRYAQAWDPSSEAAWCAAFDEEDLRVFEYHADMKYYYVDGYGHDINLQLGCPLVKDVIDKLSAYERREPTSAGAMYFTHSTAIHMTLAVLGVGRDVTPLTADNYETMKNERGWAISRLAPFAANIAVVLYECPATSDEKYKIRMYINEHPTTVAGCEDPDALCSWDDFKKRFAKVSASCSLDFCTRSAAAAGVGVGAGRLLHLLAAAAAALTLLLSTPAP